MNARTLASASPALASLSQQGGTWWRARTPRERQAVVWLLTLLIAFAVWALLIQPAWRVANTAPAQIDQLNAQLEQMKRVAAEAQSLRGTPPVSVAQASAALKSSTDRLGDKARLTLQGDRATLTLTGVTGDGLRAWLVEARSGARARPVEAQLQRGANGYTGSLVVAIGAGS